MPVLIALPMYPTKEICKKLAKLKGRHEYARQQVDDWIKNKIPTAQKFGNTNYLTDSEIEWLATQIRAYKPRQKKLTSDNKCTTIALV